MSVVLVRQAHRAESVRSSDRSKSSMRLRPNFAALKLLDDIDVVVVFVVVVVVVVVGIAFAWFWIDHIIPLEL